MTGAAFELQRAIHAQLTGSAALSAAMGGVRIYDHAPLDARFPYLTHGRAGAQDWSSGTEEGTEHRLTLNVWSRARGRAEALGLMAMIAALVHDRPLTLPGHALINLRVETQEADYDDELSVYHGRLRLRAVTETLPEN